MLKGALNATLALCLISCTPADTREGAPSTLGSAPGEPQSEDPDDGSAAPAVSGAGMPSAPIHRASAGATADRPTSDASVVSAATPTLPPGAVPPSASDDDAGLAPPAGIGQQPALPQPLHRYAFASDSEGVVLHDGARLDNGELLLDGADDYAQLPSGLLSSLRDLTILVWLRWEGGEPWQRVIDFGSASTQNGMLHVHSNLFVTPRGAASNLPLVGFIDDKGGDEHVEGGGILSAPVALQLGMSFDSQTHTLGLIINGALAGKQSTTLQFAAVSDMTPWLGRSRFDDDPHFRGSISELRIYSSVLDAVQLEQLYARGADAP